MSDKNNKGTQQELPSKQDVKELVSLLSKETENASDWDRHSLLVLETLKDLKKVTEKLDERVDELEKKFYAISMLVSVIVFFVEYGGDVIELLKDISS